MRESALPLIAFLDWSTYMPTWCSATWVTRLIRTSRYTIEVGKRIGMHRSEWYIDVGVLHNVNSSVAVMSKGWQYQIYWHEFEWQWSLEERDLEIDWLLSYIQFPSYIPISTITALTEISSCWALD